MVPLAASDEIEILRPDFSRGPYRAALFDFDGTLSLIRRNWPNVMIPMMVDVLAATGTAETRDSLHAAVEDFVMRLNGKQTIYQMIQLTEEIRKRGGTPLEPVAYKHKYHELLTADMGDRVERLENGGANPDDWTVPESRSLLEALRERGVTMYLASGTDLTFVRRELAALRLDEFFGGHVYGALDNYQDFSKAKIVRQIVHDSGVPPQQLLAFGDGFVEIQEVASIGGTAIGVASEEEKRVGINAWKRGRLVDAGAQIIIGDYRCRSALFNVLEI
jgi:phosphoglycolate phosphatase